MRKRIMPEMKEGGVNVTPLIDIVMCLIIFFMLVAKIGVDTGADHTISIPASVIGTNISDMSNTLNLNVKAGAASLGEPEVTALIKNQLQELHVTGNQNNLVATLKYFREGDKNFNIAANPDFKVIIRGDESMPFEFLQPVLLCCAEAGVKNVSFVTKIESSVSH